MRSHGYEEVDHTADLALRVWGETFHAVLRSAAVGIYALMGVLMESGDQVEAAFKITENAPEIMLVDFLNELLYLCDEKRLAFETFRFVEEEQALLVRAEGYRVTSINRMIKAVTFHDLFIKESGSGLETTITFDV